jgi:hypothetical protein
MDVAGRAVQRATAKGNAALPTVLRDMVDAVKSLVSPPRSESASVSPAGATGLARLAQLTATVNATGAQWETSDVQSWLQNSGVPDAALFATRAFRHGGILAMYAECVLDGRTPSAAIQEFYSLFDTNDAVFPRPSVISLVMAIKMLPLTLK